MIYLQDIKLKAVILEFIATAVETQPGLIELFLDLTNKDDKVQWEFHFQQNIPWPLQGIKLSS